MLEEEFGRGMQKLAKNTADMYAMNDGKAGCVNPIFSFLITSGPDFGNFHYMQFFRQRMADNHENSRGPCRQQATICVTVERNERGAGEFGEGSG